MGGELSVLVDTCAEQPLQRLGLRGYGGGPLVRRDFGAVGKPLSVAANECFRAPFDQPAKPLAEQQIERRLRQMPGHSEALRPETVDPGGATTTHGHNPGLGMPSRPIAGRH
jgi:hypothetical protein